MPRARFVYLAYNQYKDMGLDHEGASAKCRNLAATLDKRNGMITFRNIRRLLEGSYEPTEPDSSLFTPADILLSIKSKIFSKQ